MSNLIGPFYGLDNSRFATKQTKFADTKVPSLSKHGHEFISECNDKYGEGNWRFAWKYGAQYLNYLEACQKYEDGFVEHFKQNPEKLEYLQKNAKEIYDTSHSNVESGADYLHQEDESTHLQDITIRRIMAQNDMKFEGDKMIQIRSTSEDKVGKTLTPLRVPFHEPKEVDTEKEIPTIEDFWQCNRIISTRA